MAGAAGWPTSEPVTSWGQAELSGQSPPDKQPHMESASHVITVEGAGPDTVGSSICKALE